RNERHFNAFSGKCLPDLAARKKDRKLTIWSAGCSTGEEPYTISICINESLHLFPGWKIEILATDIANSVLDFAREGRYSGRRIEKVSAQFLQKYFTRIQDGPSDKDTVYEVKDSLRRHITFKPLNLFKDPFPTGVDIIFCRNVMIYFDREHQTTLVNNFYRSISKENGYLFIGHSETLHSISEDFAYIKLLDAPVYVPVQRLNEFKRN
ncbi:MAG: CheR family methyltransferase, partial [Spirochaetota bacterium]